MIEHDKEIKRISFISNHKQRTDFAQVEFSCCPFLSHSTVPTSALRVPELSFFSIDNMLGITFHSLTES